MERQTDESFLMDSKAGSSLGRKRHQFHLKALRRKRNQGKLIQKDDTAPKEEPAKRLCYDADLTGNEDDSVFRKLADCFTDGYYGEWAGFYKQGYPASSQHRHMFWHVKYRKTMAPHQNHWFSN